MTDTVPVPIEYLQELKAEYPLAASRVAGPIPALVNLIPNPLKVGDEVTVAQVTSLLPKTVLRDSDDDVWIVDNVGDLHLITFKRGGGLSDDPQVAEDTIPYSPVIVSLPSDV